MELQTVKALLTERALARVGRSSHRFCPEPSCDVVYFDAEGACYRKTDIRVPVWQKEPFDRYVRDENHFAPSLAAFGAASGGRASLRRITSMSCVSSRTGWG